MLVVGVQFVMILGVEMMLKLFVDNLATDQMVIRCNYAYEVNTPLVTIIIIITQ